MRGIRFLTGGFAFVLIFSALAFSQTEKTPNAEIIKVAVIDTEAFDNKETGIKEIVEAYDKIEIEFKPQAEEVKIIGEKIQKLQKEIEVFQSVAEKFKGNCGSSEVNKKFEEYDKLTKEYKQRQDEIKLLYDKRKPEIFADVYKKISEALKQFAKEKGYFLMKPEASMFVSDTEDVTKEFIKYYNDNFAEAKPQ